MDIVIDASNNYSPIQVLPNDFSMSHHETRQQQYVHESDNTNSFLAQHEMMKMTNKTHEKKVVTFPFGQCRICQDNATGVHYGVITCEGCKGFFKRSITQGVPYRCFFGDNCIINVETRNRCKACRFKRCLQQGMGMESVKMGRIPKKIKEKALRDYHRQQDRQFQYDQQPLEENQDSILYYGADQDDFETDLSHLPSVKPEFFSDVPSISSSSSSSLNMRQSTDSSQENITVPDNIVDHIEEEVGTDDLTNKTTPSSDIHVNSLNANLSSLRLPTIFYESHPTSDIHADTFVETFTKINRDNTNEHSSQNVKQTNSIMTVATYITKIHQNTLVESMASYEMRYSKNVLPMMKYLSSKLCQPFLIYELDFEVSTFFRYIRWKMWNLYLQHMNKIQMFVQRMLGIINLGITDYPGANATLAQIWEAIQVTMPIDVNDSIAYAKDMPGINELNTNDLTQILNNRTFEFWTITHYPLFYKGESYVMTETGLQYTRRLMSQLIGKKTTDALHDFSSSLHALNITQVEHSLIIPIILCLSDEQVEDATSLRILKHCYMYALYIQLCTTRTESEAKIIFDNIVQIIDSVDLINKLCRENIGRIRIE